MRIQYRNTKEDLGALRKRVPRGKWWGQVGSAVGLLAAAALPGTVVLAVAGHWSVVGICWAVALLLIAKVIWSQNGKVLSALPEELPLQTLTLQEDCLAAESEGGWSRRHWGAMHKVEADGERFYLYEDEFTAWVVPRRAFETPEVAEQFWQEVKRLQQNPPEEAVYWQASESSWLQELEHQTSAEIVYHNTWEDFREFYQFVQQRNREASAASQGVAPTRSKRPLWWSQVVMMLMALVLATQLFSRLAMPALMDYLLAAALFLILLILTGTFVYPAFQRFFLWIERERILQTIPKNQTLLLSTAGVGSRSDKHMGHNPWSSFSGIEETEQHLFLLMQKSSGDPLASLRAFIIPKASFANSAAVQHFYNQAHSFIDRFGPRPAAPTAEAIAPQESGNPYQPPRFD